MPNYERARGEDDTNNPWDTLRDLDLSQESISEQEQESVLENQARIRGKTHHGCRQVTERLRLREKASKDRR